MPVAFFVVFLVEKFPPIAGELADYRWQAEHTFVSIHQIDAPLVRLRIVQSQRLRLYVEGAVRVIYFELLEVGICIEQRRTDDTGSANKLPLKCARLVYAPGKLYADPTEAYATFSGGENCERPGKSAFR